MAVREITPSQAAALVKHGALLVDIRETAERESGLIPGAAHLPLSGLDDATLDTASRQPVIFHCRSGGRTRINADALEAKAVGCDTYLLQGGIEAWRASGLPVERA